MGWKASVIIVSNVSETDTEVLLSKLGLSNLTKIEDEPFNTVINPPANKVYTGFFNNNLIICESDLPTQIITNDESEAEKTLSSLFPNSEICSLILHSSVNLWGYAVVKKGQKIRARAGTSDDGTFIDIGQPLEEEKKLLSQSTLNEDGSRTYILPDFEDEEFSEDQVGENFVFEISSRYLGEKLDYSDELLDTMMTGYSFSKVKKGQNAPETSSSKPWWKFW